MKNSNYINHKKQLILKGIISKEKLKIIAKMIYYSIPNNRFKLMNQ